MGAELRIENDKVIALAHRFADLTGKSVEAAMSQSLEDSVAREELIQAKLARVRAITAEIRAMMGDPLPSSDHSHLYDENGLPV